MHHTGEDRKGKGYYILSEYSERNSQAKSGSYAVCCSLHSEGYSEYSSHDTADDGVGGLCASDRHTSDLNQLVSAAYHDTKLKVTKDSSDDRAGNDGLVQRFQKAELVDTHDKGNYENQKSLDN